MITQVDYWLWRSYLLILVSCVSLSSFSPGNLCIYKYTYSHRIAEPLRLVVSSWDCFVLLILFKQEKLEQVVLSLVQWLVSFSKDRDSVISLNNQSQCSVICTIKIKKYFLVFRLNCCCCSCCCCYFEFVDQPVMSEKNLTPSFPFPPIGYWNTDKILTGSSFLQAEQAHFLLPLQPCEKCCSLHQSLWLSAGLGQWNLCFSFTGEFRPIHSTLDEYHQCWLEEKNHLPLSTGYIFPNAAREAVGPCWKSTLLAYVQLLVHQVQLIHQASYLRVEG